MNWVTSSGQETLHCHLLYISSSQCQLSEFGQLFSPLWMSVVVLSSLLLLSSLFDFRFSIEETQFKYCSTCPWQWQDDVGHAGSISFKIEYCLYIIIVEERRERKEIVHVQRSWIHPLRIERMADRTISLMRTKLLYKSIEFQLVWLIVEL